MLHKFLPSIKIMLLFLFLALILLVFMFNPFKKSPKDVNTQSFKVQTFDGTLEENHVYEATWPIEDEILNHLPYHHSFNIEWKNIAKFPQLKNSDKFVFKVISKKTYKVSDQYRWNDEYVCEIVDVQKP